ncbi:MAG: D-Ala-D-Ala carboxypeptidase family metallohydrolase [Candidatus Helarchaeota archaeon]
MEKQLRNLDSYIPGCPNFKYKEFVLSPMAMRYGIELKPDESQWNAIELLCQNILQPIRNIFGPIRITSGYRSPELNKKIGGSEFSNHCLGQAADFEPIYPNVRMIDIFEYIARNLEFRELIAEYFPTGWIHVAFRINENIKQIKLKDKDHNYKIVDLEYVKKLHKNI